MIQGCMIKSISPINRLSLAHRCENRGRNSQSINRACTIMTFLSSRSVIECCVMPILMYGSENWILTEVLIDKLEAFQGELVKRVLKWPKHHSNTAAITALEMPTMRSRLLVTKLGCLCRVMESSSGSFSGRVLEA